MGSFHTSVLEAIKTWVNTAEVLIRQFAPPYPQRAKMDVLSRYAPAGIDWVETGTFRGTTTEFLSRFGKSVSSLEPSTHFYRKAVERFTDNPAVMLYNASSEDGFEGVVAGLTGRVGFWLDGHYSGGATFQGNSECPVLTELEVIAKYVENFDDFYCFIDDLRCFSPFERDNYPDYPDIQVIVDWANKMGCKYFFDRDIIVIAGGKDAGRG